ncbi:MAG: major capsid protein [Gemmatimonadota bacterium]|nr:major capsid protein [Gemmatimonadota bacterium]
MLNNLLAQTRIQTIVEEAQPLLQRDGGLWGNRIPDQDATDLEIIGRDSNLVTAADLIMDDATAPLRNEPALDLVQHKVANLKRHTALKQEELALLDRIVNGGGMVSDITSFDSFLARRVTNALRSVKILRGILCAGMVVDSLVWNKLGLNLNLTFGAHAALKVTPAVLWSTAATATPVSDIHSLNVIASDSYGAPKNRVTMSRASYNFMLATTEYQDKAKGSAGMYLNANLPVNNDPRSAQLASAVLGMVVEIDDSQYRLEANDGTVSTARYVAANKVLLTSTEDDNDAGVWNFGNAIIMESIADVNRTIFGGAVRGPVGYSAPANGQLNPPQIAIFAVQRGMARKMDRGASAILTVSA